MPANIARHSEKSARIHPKSMQNQCKPVKTVKVNAVFPECLAMLAAMPRDLRSTSDPEFFVLSRANHHIRSQEASPCRNSMPTHRFQTGILFLSVEFYFYQIHELSSVLKAHIDRAGHMIEPAIVSLLRAWRSRGWQPGILGNAGKLFN